MSVTSRVQPRKGPSYFTLILRPIIILLRKWIKEAWFCFFLLGFPLIVQKYAGE